MKRYYHRNYYSRGNSDFSLRQYFQNILQALAGLVALVILGYILPVYFYIIEHPVLLIPVGIGVVIIAVWIYFYRDHKKKIRMRAMTRFSEVMKLDWREFEEFVAEILKEKWFHTILWVGIRDGWVDVTATLWDKKFFVQCKHYREDSISVEKIRELHGVMTGELIPVWGIFVTTTWFTPDSVSEAKKYGIDLWDRNYLIKYIENKRQS